jgi:RNA-directed DNA polymerase
MRRKEGARAETFDFLGLTHYCGTKKDGKGFRMKRVTARKKFIAKLKIFKEWLKKARILTTKELWQTAKAKLRGQYNYYGVTDNLCGIVRFGEEAAFQVAEP